MVDEEITSNYDKSLRELFELRPSLSLRLEWDCRWAMACFLSEYCGEGEERRQVFLEVTTGEGDTIESAALAMLENLGDADLIAEFITKSGMKKTFLHAIRESEVSEVFLGCDQRLGPYWSLDLVWCVDSIDSQQWKLTKLGHRVAARLKNEWP
jgi:hypothetical protein